MCHVTVVKRFALVVLIQFADFFSIDFVFKKGSDIIMTMNWIVYILLCSDNSLYTGITTDVERRVEQHAVGRGAKYFRGRKPKKLLYIEVGYNRGEATKREAEIKKMSRAEKLRLTVE